ncbi:hypothetical protein IKF88_00840 [Candidatus Saccharibacteria bacterium]|nr:hypothetical protein [Candidatus Saccharibacteria bacterium]MBR3254263.1 hypothetical protein [Candidatus Saccharibacteria bacterium]
MKIAIIGAGAFGTALGGILANKGYDIDYYDSKFGRENLNDVVDGAKYIVLALPSKSTPYVLPHLPKKIPLIIATKGILSNQAFKDFDDYMILSGPGFADDIKAKKSIKLTITDKRLAKMFDAEYIAFDYTDDENGVLMCGALKNVYAILAGILGLKRSGNDWKYFVEMAASEMKKILAFNGANPKTVDLACGFSDLKLTCGYPSRNYEFGDKLRKDPDYLPEKTVEGVSALKRIKRGEIKLPDNVPYLRDLISRSDKWA